MFFCHIFRFVICMIIAIFKLYFQWVVLFIKKIDVEEISVVGKVGKWIHKKKRQNARPKCFVFAFYTSIHIFPPSLAHSFVHSRCSRDWRDSQILVLTLVFSLFSHLFFSFFLLFFLNLSVAEHLAGDLSKQCRMWFGFCLCSLASADGVMIYSLLTSMYTLEIFNVKEEF